MPKTKMLLKIIVANGHQAVIVGPSQLRALGLEHPDCWSAPA